MGLLKKGQVASIPYSGAGPANGRVSIFTVNGAGMFTINGIQTPGREASTGTNTSGTEMVSVTGSPLRLFVSVPYDDAWSDPVAFPSNYLTQLTNGNFASCVS